MTNHKEVSSRIEKIFRDANGHKLSKQAQYDLYESIAIQILDSEFMDFADGELEMYLAVFLEEKAKSLSIDR